MAGDVETEWARLLRAANGGDGKAYRRFLEYVTPVLRSIVRHRAAGIDATEREDIVQEVLLAIHTKRHTWRDSEPVRPWLFAIARYKAIDSLRARGRRVDVPIDDFADVLPAPDTEDPTLRGDIERALGRLDERSAAVVRAMSIDGASAAETGKLISLGEGAVRVVLHRALKKLAGMRIRDEV